MKKFVFTLETVFQYKQTVERERKADLKRAQDALRLLQEERERLAQKFEENVRSREEALQKREDVGDALKRHDAYFVFLREAQKKLAAEILRAEAERDRRQALLVETMKEVKIYKKLKEEQYLAYLEEVRLEEAKDMGDLVSYQTVAAE